MQHTTRKKLLALLLTLVFIVSLFGGLQLSASAEEPEEYTVTFKSSAIGSKGKLVLLPLDIENAEEIVIQASSMEFITGRATASLTAGRYSYKGYKQNGDYLGGGTLEVSANKTSFQLQGVSFNLVVEYFEMENPPLFSELNGTLRYEINKENELDIYYASILTLEEIDEHCTTTSVNIGYRTLVANGGTADPTVVRFYYETDDPRVICTDYSISCTGFAASSTGRGVILSPATPRTIRVPTEFKDSFHVYHKGNAHFYPFEELIPASVTDREDGYTDFSYYMPNAYSFHYLLDGDDEHIKIGRLYSYTPDQTQYTFTVQGYSKTEGDGYDNFDLDNQLRLANRGSEEDNLYLSVPDNNYLVLDSGEEERIEAYRVWEAVTDLTGNYFIEPNFHYEVIGDSVTVAEAGAAGREYAVIHAAGNGISVIKVTYDAMCWAKGYVDDPENDSSTKYYNAIDPVNTRVVIVRVGEANATAIDSGITQREYDTIYYDGGETDHADFTFTPTAADGSALSVRVHAPLHDAEWGSAWQEYEAAGDGSFTVALTDGRNIIEISAPDGSVEYYVVNCRALQVNVENLTRPGAEDYRAGDQLRVTFVGLSLPLQKMAAVYNPNYGGGGWVEYSSSLGQAFQSEAVQYNIQTNNAIQFTLTEPGVYKLVDGKIHGTHFGEPLDYHRSIPSGGKTPMLSAPEFNDGYFSTLPDLVFSVLDENETGDAYNATLLIPDGATLTVRNSLGYHKQPVSVSGNAYTFSLVNFDGDAEMATYTWILEKEGFGAEAGIFVIEDQDLTLDLTDVTLQPLAQTEGAATVRIAGYDRVLRMTQTVEVDPSAPADLAVQGYVLYNHGGYTVLHALIEAETFGNERRFDCAGGVFAPKAALPAGVSGCWVCEVNGEECADPANTLLNAGDQVEFYFLAEGETTRAWFTEETDSIVKGESLTLTLMGAASGETAAPLAGVPVFVGEAQAGETDADGQIVIPAEAFRSYRSYRVSAGGVNGGTATYALCWLQVTKPETAQGSTTTVTFRLIGDAIHGEEDPAGHEYVTWVPTTAYTFSGSSVTVGQVFAQAMADAGFSYTGLSNGYIDSVTVPEALGGYTLAEMDNGPLSGWMYTVNGFHPNLSLNDKVVSDGDEIVWHYVDAPVNETYDWHTGTTGDSSMWDTWFDAYEEIPVSGLSLDIETAEVAEGKTIILTATVTPEFATDPTVTWSSSDESIATVVGGVVIGVKAGTVTITAAVGELSATCTVEVTAALAIASVTADKNEAEVGESITWTATATGGKGSKTYLFYLYNGSELVTKTKYSASNTFTYAPAEPGSYNVKVFVKDGAGTSKSKSGGKVTVTEASAPPADPLTITAVTADKNEAEVGESITWTATAAGGEGNKTYLFYIYNGSELMTKTKYSASNTFTYAPTAAGSYNAKVFVKDGAGTSKSKSGGKVTVTEAAAPPADPLTITAVTADKTAAEVGESITWTATAAGGEGSLKYYFYIYNGSTAVKKTGYINASTFTYAPTEAGSYSCKVFVKDEAGASKSKTGGKVTVTEPAAPPVVDPLVITAVTANKTAAEVGESITWTAAATGGEGSLKYCFYIYNGSELVKKTSYAASNTFTYAPAEAGSYNAKVFVKDEAGTSKSKTGGKVTVTEASEPPAGPLAIASVTASKTSAAVGDSITWTATATGGEGSLKYYFYIYNGSTVVKKTGYINSSTFTFTVTEAGSYSCKVFVKDEAGTSKSKTGGKVTVTA